MNTLGERIKFHRKRMGLTQEQLAERMGVSPQAVSKWENNQSCPDIAALPTLAALFGISVDELLGNEAKKVEIVDETEGRRGYHWRWNWNLHSALFPVYIMVVGALLLFNHFMGYDVSWWTVVWTSGLVFIGASGLCSGFSVFNSMLVLGGAYFLLSAYDLFAWRLSWSVVLPAALLVWGLSLLIDSFTGKKKRKAAAAKKQKREYHCENGQFSCDLAFGEYCVSPTTSLLTGGTIDTCFGSFNVDLSGCERVAPGCTLRVDNSFGRVTLLVPKRFSATIINEDGFSSGVGTVGEHDAVVQGEIFVELDNSFGNFTVSYINA